MSILSGIELLGPGGFSVFLQVVSFHQENSSIKSQPATPSHELLLILPMILHGFAREAEPMHNNIWLTLLIWVLQIFCCATCKNVLGIISLSSNSYSNVAHISFSFAFVEFESTDDAKDALENINNTEIEGRSIRLEYSQNSGRGEGGRGNSGRFSELTSVKLNSVVLFEYVPKFS